MRISHKVKGWSIAIGIYIILFVAILLTRDMDKTDYHFNIVYTDGHMVYLVEHSANSFIRPVLEAGCLKWYDSSISITCGVRSFTYYKTRPKN